MAEAIKGTACALLLAAIGLLTWLGVVTPMPSHAGVGLVIDRTLRTATAELDVHVLGGGERLQGARDLVALDPHLTGLGNGPARLLATQSPNLGERLAMGQLLVARHPTEMPVLDEIVNGVVTRRRLDLAAAVATAAQELPGSDRAVLADAVATQWYPVDAKLATATALRIDETPIALNARGVWVTDPVQARALFSKAHAEDPSNPIIGGNWAASMKLRALATATYAALPQYDALLSKAMTAVPNDAYYQQVLALQPAPAPLPTTGDCP